MNNNVSMKILEAVKDNNKDIFYLCDECIGKKYVYTECDDDEHTCQNCGEDAYFKAVKADTEVGQVAREILDWVGNYYGSQEMESPSYDIIELAKFLVSKKK